MASRGSEPDRGSEALVVVEALADPDTAIVAALQQ
jgi:hypothetical protein